MDTNNTEIIIFEIKKYSKSDTIIIYDGDCPVCNNITLLSKIDKTSNSVDLLNAREKINSGVRHRITKVRFDITYPLGPRERGPLHIDC